MDNAILMRAIQCMQNVVNKTGCTGDPFDFEINLPASPPCCPKALHKSMQNLKNFKEQFVANYPGARTRQE